MNFQLKHRHTVCPPELSDQIESKIDRLTRVLPENSYVEIEISELAHDHTNGSKRAEIVVDLPGESLIRFEAKAETFLAAVDQILDKVDELVTKRMDRKHDHHYNGKSPKEWLADTVNQATVD
jgi:ribosomal subunit interface protein